MFPDSKAKAFVLPVEQAVRTAEKLVERDDVTVDLTVLNK